MTFGEAFVDGFLDFENQKEAANALDSQLSQSSAPSLIEPTSQPGLTAGLPT